MCVSGLIVCLENKQGQELSVVKFVCNNIASSGVFQERFPSPQRQFRVKDLICDTSQFFSEE
jgi:hypothetical protein